MKIFVTLDDNFGMMFNNRRQSKDAKVREDILAEVGSNILWMNEYTSRQFDIALPDNINVDEDFLEKAKAEDYCFVENILLQEYEAEMSEIIIYKWNRKYPFDRKFDIVLENKWTLKETREFTGISHEKITKEIWINE